MSFSLLVLTVFLSLNLALGYYLYRLVDSTTESKARINQHEKVFGLYAYDMIANWYFAICAVSVFTIFYQKTFLMYITMAIYMALLYSIKLSIDTLQSRKRAYYTQTRKLYRGFAAKHQLKKEVLSAMFVSLLVFPLLFVGVSS